MANDQNYTSSFDEITASSTDDVTTTASYTCDDVSSFWDGYTKLYILPYTTAILVGLSFVVQRTQLRRSCCWGRPAVAYPINLLDEYGRRWLFALCYVIMASNVLNLFLGTMYIDPMPKNDPDWTLKFSWVSVFVKLLNVILVCFVYYPLFACISHRQHIIANIFGFIYAAPLLAFQIKMSVECASIPTTPGDWTGVYIVWIPEVLSLVIYLVYCVIEFAINIRRRCRINALQVLDTRKDNEIEQTSYHRYVNDLLQRHKKVKPNQEEPTTTSGKIKKKFAGLVKRFKYRTVVGFHYPVRLICALVVSALVVFWLVVSIGIQIDEVFVDTIQPTLVHLAELIKGLTFGEQVGDYINICRIVFHVANTTSGVLQIVYMLITLVMFKKRMMKLFRGDNRWHVTVRSSPSALLVSGMRYPGYQIAFLIYGWVFTTVMLWLILSALSILIFVPIRDRVRNWVVNKIIQLWPAIVISFAIYYAQILLCKYAFLQDKGAVLALNNRRWYHVTSYILFVFNMIVGVFAGLKRILLSLVLGTIRLGRLDNVLIMRGFERLDSGHMSYVAMMIVDVAHNHPVLRTFIELLQEIQRERKASIASGVSMEARQHRQRVRMKWLKAITLVNNPPLILERIEHLYRRRAKRTETDTADIPPLYDVQDSTAFVMTNLAYSNGDGISKRNLQHDDVQVENEAPTAPPYSSIYPINTRV